MEQPWAETIGEYPVAEADQEDWLEAEVEDEWAEAGFEFETEAEAEHNWGEAGFEFEAEEEWSNPFSTTAETFEDFEAETDWSSPFAASTELEDRLWEAPQWESAFEDLAAPAPGGATCRVDKQAPGPKWNFKPKTAKTPGKADSTRFDRNEIIELHLSEFRVDDYHLMDNHFEALRRLASDISTKVRNKTYVGPVRIRVIGEASSTASITHNVTLSEHRAFNTACTLECLIDKNLPRPFEIKWAAVGEQRSARATGDSREAGQFRGVLVRVMAPVTCPHVTPPRPPAPRPPGRRTPTTRPPAGRSTALCVAVTRIEPRRSGGIPPEVIPLNSIIPGIPLPLAIVTKGRAHVKVDNQTNGGSANMVFSGWGLEIALPSSGQVTVDLRARLQASLDAMVRASASLAGRLQLGPLGLALKIDASAFARLVVRLAAELRIHLSVGFGPRPFPELSGCTRLMANGPYDPRHLAGPASLVIPGRGLGAAQLRLASPSAGPMRLSANPIALPADKSTVRGVLLLGGTLSLAGVTGGRAREDEAAAFEWEGVDEWEALGEGETLDEWEAFDESELFDTEFEGELVRGI